MATLNEIAYDLLSTVRPQISDDSELEISQIKFWINTARSLFIRNQINQGRTIPSDIIQTICLELESVNVSDCCDIKLDCEVLRSNKDIPKTIDLYNKESILRVGSVNKLSRSFSYIDYSAVAFVANGKYNKDEVFAFLHDKRIFIYTKNKKYQIMTHASLRGVFENPQDASEFKDCVNGQACFSDDDEYPISLWMIPSIKDLILKNYLSIQERAEIVNTDNSNNAKTDLVAK